MLLFFETACGIGCKVCNGFNEVPAPVCPGGVCAYKPARSAGGNWAHALVVWPFVGAIGVWTSHVAANDRYARPLAPTTAPGHR